MPNLLSLTRPSARIILCLLSTIPCSLSAILFAQTRTPIGPSTAAPIHLKIIQNNLILVPVCVNGAGPFDFLLDTGTSTTVIHREFARRLGLRAVDRVELVTVTGTQVVPRSYVERINIGPATAHKVEVLWSDLPEIGRRAPGVVGVIGQNFLASFNYFLDYERRTLLFEPEGGFGCRLVGERLPMELHEHRPMVTIQQADKRGATLRLLLDSGVGTLVLFDSGTRKLAAELSLTNSGLAYATTDAGTSTVTMAQLTRLKIGGVRFTALPVALLMQPAGPTHAEDGLLPLSLFRSLYVNHKQQYLIVNPHLNF